MTSARNGSANAFAFLAAYVDRFVILCLSLPGIKLRAGLFSSRETEASRFPVKASGRIYDKRFRRFANDTAAKRAMHNGFFVSGTWLQSVLVSCDLLTGSRSRAPATRRGLRVFCGIARRTAVFPSFFVRYFSLLVYTQLCKEFSFCAVRHRKWRVLRG